jgi:hypothetical protein
MPPCRATSLYTKQNKPKYVDLCAGLCLPQIMKHSPLPALTKVRMVTFGEFYMIIKRQILTDSPAVPYQIPNVLAVCIGLYLLKP